MAIMNAPPTPACGFHTIWPSSGPCLPLPSQPRKPLSTIICRALGNTEVTAGIWAFVPATPGRIAGPLVDWWSSDGGLVGQIRGGIHGEQGHVRTACLPLNARWCARICRSLGCGDDIVPRLDEGVLRSRLILGGGSILAAAAIGTRR